jgi:hypothetical protein
MGLKEDPSELDRRHPYKVGDRVRHLRSGRTGEVMEVRFSSCGVRFDNDPGRTCFLEHRFIQYETGPEGLDEGGS